jgi:transposase
MRGRPSFFDIDERLHRLSGLGDHLEAFAEAVDFEMLRADFMAALNYSDGAQGGRPPFIPVMMFKILVIQAMDNLSDERAEFLISDRMFFMRFLGLSLADRVPDARTIWLYREKLTKAGAIEPLFARFDAALRASGYIPMSGQIVDAALVATPKQRNTEDEKKAINEGRILEEWKDRPAKLRQKDRDARSRCALDCEVQHGERASRRNEATRRHRHNTNTASSVWADTAYRSAANATFMEKSGFVSRVHRKKPKGKPMPEAVHRATAPPRHRATAEKPKVRSYVKHVFAAEKDRTGLLIRTIGIARAKVKIGMANLVYNFMRLIFLQRTTAA